MNRYIYLLVFFWFFSCQSSDRQHKIETLQLVVQDLESENRQTLMIIREEIEILDRKEEHLEIYSRIQSLVKLREQHVYQLNNIGDFEIYEENSLNAFLDKFTEAQVESVVNMDVINQKIQEYRIRIKALSKEEGAINNYLILINLLHLESDLLEEYAAYFGHT